MVRAYAVPNGGTRYAEYLALDAAERAYWVGRGAEQLGLIGYVEPRQFNLLELGMHPETEKRLRPRIMGHLQGRTVFDVVVMAPKSVSIVGLFDDRVVQAHRETIREIQSQIEDYACVRVRRGEFHQTDTLRPSRNIVAGVWHHEKNRELEPLEHSHIAVVNMTYDPVEDRWKALQAVEIYRHRWELSEAYRHSLAQRLMGYGYDLSPRLLDESRYPKHAIKEREWGFEIDGVSPNVIGRFSERTQQRDEAISEYRERHAVEEVSEKVISNLVRQSRKPKQEYSDHERIAIREEQREKLTQAERISLRQTVEKAYERSHKLRLNLTVAEGEESGPRHRETTYGQRISM